ncbi:Hint domain-containing protein [Roseofilum sp. BLCC_M154]|uniref:Hint domain-containing protein n=1 Tax=Roseofilum acuticapitatum BLCC-M154 TaxID=3022444 RepID=A0ABT7AVG5_9CYAN|nr:Hint domain-containing protein [Roseofilum acuticapitatum]MDJ1170908.1 Hint domain-containing protein [Roseofilum acuticapitatum BLCC-M154]
MATYDILVFSWNDIFPSLTQTGGSLDFIGETFTFNGGGDIVTYDDRFGDRNELGDNTGGLDDFLRGTIDGQSVDTLINPEYAYEITDSNGVAVGKMYALTKATDAVSSIEGFVFDFQPIKGETYTLTGRDDFPQTASSNLYICFVNGTLIDTVDGPVAVEDITAGMQVITRDNGPQPILWVGSAVHSFAEISSNPKSAPVLINKGALGDGFPEQMLMISPQHRILVRSKVAQRMFGCDEVMVPAVKLTELDGVERVSPQDGVTYHHILCANHEMVRANGHWSETLYFGEQTEIAIGAEKTKEILAECSEVEDMQMHPLALIGEENRGRLKNFARRMSKRRPLYINQ